MHTSDRRLHKEAHINMKISEFFQPQQTRCLRCGGAYFDSLELGLCPACALHVHSAPEGDLRAVLKHGRDVLDWAGAALMYSDGVRERVHALKYGGARKLGEQMGREMHLALQGMPIMPDALLPVPLHWSRRCARGYNQAETLARGLAGQCGLPIETKLLTRARRTRSNASLDHSDRMSNVQGAFVLRGDVRGRRILLIDDVLTTGSTVSQCAGTLRAGGAAWVGVLTYARAGSVYGDG